MSQKRNQRDANFWFDWFARAARSWCKLPKPNQRRELIQDT